MGFLFDIFSMFFEMMYFLYAKILLKLKTTLSTLFSELFDSVLSTHAFRIFSALFLSFLEFLHKFKSLIDLRCMFFYI